MVLSIFFLIAAGKALAGQELSLACEDCTVSQETLCAMEAGYRLSLPDRSRVWIFDVPDGEVSTYRLSVTPEGSEFGTRSTTDSGSTVVATPEPLAPDEARALNEFARFLRDVLRPVGGGRPLEECRLSDQGEVELKSRRLQQTGVPIEPPVVFPVNVPADVVESGFEDLIEMRQIGPWFQGRFDFADTVAQTFLLAYSVIGGLTGVPLDTRVIVEVIFSDGSSGLLVFELDGDGGSWEIDPDSLVDSDGNVIPTRVGDIPSAFQFSGEPPGENNLERQIRRMERLGVLVIRMTRPGSGGGSSCEMNAEGVYVCTSLK